ncbi:hypothetical protein ACSSS7_006995 [Eimeria intestinalis]
MLDCCYCFTRGGVLMWSFGFARLQGPPLNQLIETVLLEERVGSSCASLGGYCFQWFYLNSIRLIFVAAYRGVRHVAQVDHLLQQTARAFENHIQGIDNALNYPLEAGPARHSFDDVFLHIMSEAQQREQDQASVQQEGQQPLITKDCKYAKRAKEKGRAPPPSNPSEAGRWIWAGENKVTRKTMDALDYSRRHPACAGDSADGHSIDREIYGADSGCQQSEEEGTTAEAYGGWLSLLPKSLQKLTGSTSLVRNRAEEAQTAPYTRRAQQLKHREKSCQNLIGFLSKECRRGSDRFAAVQCAEKSPWNAHRHAHICTPDDKGCTSRIDRQNSHSETVFEHFCQQAFSSLTLSIATAV